MPTHPLAYAEFWQLVAMASAAWDELLVPALGKKSDMLPLLKRADDLRNTVGHSRELLAFEADLLSGIAGDVRNRVAIYLSSTDPLGDIYPRIEAVRDQFGTSWEPGQARSVDGAVALRQGDAVRFQCRGTDPQGRQLSWWVGSWSDRDKAKSGDEVELEVHLTEDEDVSERTFLTINMVSSGKHHRRSSYGDHVTFSYRVDPPLYSDPGLSESGDPAEIEAGDPAEVESRDGATAAVADPAAESAEAQFTGWRERLLRWLQH